MILDKQLMFSEAQAVDSGVTFATGNQLSTNTIDLGAVGSQANGGTPIYDIGRGDSIRVMARVVTAFTSGGSATMVFQLVQADNAALSSNLEVLAATNAIAVASLVAGYKAILGFVPQGVTKRYIGMRYVVATANMTAGAVTSGLVIDTQSNL
ncbi:MAG: hypothetical protein IAG10_14355 [Planctomycetaceae bacterium]|nr:hypothetical protein [Planctomycetaceae bacterium]